MGNEPDTTARGPSERKRGEEPLSDSEELQRSLIEDALDAIYTLSLDGTIASINPAFETITGWPRSEWIGKGFTSLVHPDDLPAIMEAFQAGLQEHRLGILEARILSHSGEYVAMEFRGTPLLKNGELVGFLGIGRDITARKKTEEALQKAHDELEKRVKERTSDLEEANRELRIEITERRKAEEGLRKSEEKLARYLESGPDAVYTMDLKGTFLYGNRAAERLTGYSREELIGKSFLETNLLPPEYLPQTLELLELNRAGNPTGPDEGELVRKDGSRVFVEIATYPVGEGDNTEIIGVARDISERKKAEQEKQKIEEHLHHTARLAAVGQLAAGVAHELNNPLAAVQGFAQLLADRKDLEESIRSDVEALYNEAKRATKITANLLSFARKQQPEMRLNSVNEIIEKSLELHAYRMRVNNMDVMTELAPDLPLIMADFHQMQQVFVNIITNAEQAMTEAHGKGNLSVRSERAGDMIHITLADDGSGIPEEELETIFEPFFTTKEVGKGTGLGLDICRGIVEGHGGRLYAKSNLAEGTTFVVEMPVVSEDQTDGEETEVSPSHTGQS